MRENFEDISVETIDQIYVNVVERVLNSSNPVGEVATHNLSHYGLDNDASHIAYERHRIMYYHKYLVVMMCGRDPSAVIPLISSFFSEDSGPDLDDDE